MLLINNEVRIENTSKCNANCIMCPRDTMTRAKVTMSLDHFQNLVTQSKHLGANTISIFGYGEPLIDKDIVRRVRFCTEIGLETFITTNASLLNMDLATYLIEAGLTHIRFSFHGMSNYDKVHRGLDIFMTLRNVQNFIAKNKITYNRACKVSMTIIPMFDENIRTLRDTWEHNVDWLEIWKPHNWGGKKKFREASKKKLKTCGRPFSGPVQIQADGKVIPCCFLTDAEVVLGDTHQNTIEEILKAERYEELREKHRTSDLKGLPCEGCDQRYILDENPLIYSSRDPDREIGKTSSTKFKIKPKGE